MAKNNTKTKDDLFSMVQHSEPRDKDKIFLDMVESNEC